MKLHDPVFEPSRSEAEAAMFAYVDDVMTVVFCRRLSTDTLTLKYTSATGSTVQVPLLNTDIAWTTDKMQRFHNPPGQCHLDGKYREIHV